MPLYGGFLKWWHPTTMGFPTKNDHLGVFWGYHHLRKHPYITLLRGKCFQGVVWKAVTLVVFPHRQVSSYNSWKISPKMPWTSMKIWWVSIGHSCSSILRTAWVFSNFRSIIFQMDGTLDRASSKDKPNFLKIPSETTKAKDFNFFVEQIFSSE